ncbi:radical SAM (seleno)protein TrsS [Fusibacter ferrireducens]|uniref:Radical SAM protein n=1 Tax=Fusibacter ferrireducens TaxID=2785058 RepID=A0ABR9ZUE4_9FIRM|nr:radical SAM (seleno)protein TrsS [Fusibacter ferrireducens]MBF4694058.1 radical SAM protein [Fusibacter ferrireducens]
MNAKKIYSKTESVCPVCLKRVDAEIVREHDRSYLVKSCSEHGLFSTLIWEGAPEIENWCGDRNAFEKAAQPVDSKGCPYECGICAEHQQQSCCVLLEITQRCNLKCPVCFAEAGSEHSMDPTMSQIEAWYEMLLLKGGPFNIQLSGGEPTMRDDLPEIIDLGKRMGFNFFQLNTNGIRLAEDYDYCERVARAGLNCAFLQFDGLSDPIYKALRGRALLEQKIRAIENCKQAGIGVVLVPTVVKGVNDLELGAIIDFAAHNMPIVRGVHFQPVSYFGRYPESFSEDRMTIPALLRGIEHQTHGEIKVSAFVPPSSEHPLCSFNGKFALQKDGHFKSVSEFGKSKSCCCSVETPAEAAMKYVARQWSAPKGNTLEVVQPEQNISMVPDLTSLDAFLEQAKMTLAISGMAFQDAWTLDLKRLKSCHIHVVSQTGDLIPFCAYNLTSRDGKSLYR